MTVEALFGFDEKFSMREQKHICPTGESIVVDLFSGLRVTIIDNGSNSDNGGEVNLLEARLVAQKDSKTGWQKEPLLSTPRSSDFTIPRNGTLGISMPGFSGMLSHKDE